MTDSTVNNNHQRLRRSQQIASGTGAAASFRRPRVSTPSYLVPNRALRNNIASRVDSVDLCQSATASPRTSTGGVSRSATAEPSCVQPVPTRKVSGFCASFWTIPSPHSGVGPAIMPSEAEPIGRAPLHWLLRGCFEWSLDPLGLPGVLPATVKVRRTSFGASRFLSVRLPSRRSICSTDITSLRVI